MKPMGSAAGALLLTFVVAIAWGTEPPPPPGVHITQDSDGVVISVVVDPMELTVQTDRVELAGWQLTAGRDEPPLPLGVVLLKGEGWRISGVDLGTVKVMPQVRLEPVAARSATPPPPGLDQGSWDEMQARELASRWRGAAGRSRDPARVATPVCRGGSCWTRVLLEPVRWDPEGQRLEIASDFTVRLERVKAGSQELPSEIANPVPPYLGADPQFTPQALIVDEAEGLVHLEWSELQTLLGWPLGFLDASRIQVWEDGHQVAVDVAPGQWVELYVRPRTGEDVAGEFRKGDWTDDRVYWFVVGDGSIPSSRIGARSVPPAGATPVTEYPSTVRLRDESDCHDVSTGVPAVDDEVFYWRSAAWSSFYSPPEYLADLALDLPGLRGASATPVSFRVRLLGAASLSTLSPQHRQRFWLEDAGGAHLADVQGDPAFDFDGDTFHEDTFQVGAGDVAASTGVLYAVSSDPSDRCVGSCPAFLWDVVYVDWVEVTYPRARELVDGVCPITPGIEGTVRFQVHGAGVPAAEMRLWDVTDPTEPVRLEGWALAGGVLDFQDDAAEGTRYLAAESGAWIRPAAADFRPATDHDWASGPAGGADWIAVGPAGLVDSAAVDQLAAHRRGQGMRTAQAPLQEIYDEFCFGVPTPWAVRSFFAWAVGHWPAPAPSRVVLVGDASFDTKNQLRPCSVNCGDHDPTNDVFGPTPFPDTSMPTWLEVVPGSGVLASDSWFGRVDGDAMPDLAVGRLPGRDATDLQIAVERILNAEAAEPEVDPWTTRFEYVAGANDAAALEPVLDTAADALPGAFDQTRLYFGRSPWNGTTADADGNGVSDMVDHMNAGRAVVQWLGHSGFQDLQAYTGGSALEVSDLEGAAPNLQGESGLLTGGACYIGAFDSATVQPTLGEALLTGEGGGAASVIAHSTASYVYAADELIGGVQDTFTGLDRSPAVGDAFLEAVWRTLTAGHDSEAGSLVLLGDPAMELPLPNPQAPAALWVVDQSCSRVSLAWTAVPGTVSYSLYRSVDGGPYQAVLTRLPETQAVDGLAPPGAELRYRVSATVTSGFSSGGSPEVAVTTPPAPGSNPDQNCSCTLEAADLAAWIVHWSAVPREDPCGTADVNGDAAVTTGDLAALASLFY